MANLIAFTGKAGCGKDTAANYLVNSRRFYQASFAAKMKEAVKNMFGLPESAVYGTKDEKELPIPHLSKVKQISGRFLMQTLATEWARDVVDPDIWIYDIAKKWDDLKNVPGFAGMVISDLRFNNEAKWVREQGGIVIEIVSPAEDVINGVVGHASEQGVSTMLIDYRIVNHKIRFDDFHKSIDEAIYSALWKKTLPADKPSLTIGADPIAANTIKPGDFKFKESIKDLIVNWADEVFPDRTITNAITKLMLHEIPEYMLKQDDPLELADIGILLYDIANLAGIDLEEAIRTKMAINKQRVWGIDDTTGLMSHLKITPITNQAVDEARAFYRGEDKRVSSLNVEFLPSDDTEGGEA